MEALLNKAKELGIENAESLNQKQLEKAIAVKEQEIKKRVELLTECDSLGIDTADFDGYSNEEIEAALIDYKSDLEKNSLNAAKEQLIVDRLGLSGDLTEVTLEEITKAFDVLVTKEVTDTVDLNAGKYSETFKVNGTVYQFHPKTPASFRFADQLKTQEEWVKDTDSLEIMIEGGLSYIKKIK